MMIDTIQFTSAAVSDRGLNEGRPQNEDSYLELPEHGLFAVADGVGGAQAGEVASQMAVEILGEAFINIGNQSDPEETMRIALDRANEAIYQMSRDLPQLSSMATTVVALHVAGDIATIAHVGDSRVYRIDPNGRLFRETDDHSVVEEEVRAGRLTPEQALNHPSRNVISRALGADHEVEPDVKCVLIHPGTRFLLCSDGITRHIDDAEIRELLDKDAEPADICAEMKGICFSRGAEDNLTAVIVSFPGDRTAGREEAVHDEVEEVTLAGVREQPGVENGASPDRYDGDVLDLSETITEEPEPTPAKDHDDEAYLIEEPDGGAAGPVSEIDDTVRIDAELVATEEPTADPEPRTSPLSYALEPDTSSGSGVGRYLGALGLLLLGALAGLAGGYYLFRSITPPPEVPVFTEQKTDNIPLTSFETRRRLVDEDPQKYLNANAATPQEADDFFWLGRALLLTGKPVEARRAFEEARTRLGSFDDRSSARTMANEIAMAMAIIDDERAREAFAKLVPASTADQAPGNGNTNANRTGATR